MPPIASPSPKPPDLVIASGNAGKIREFSRLLDGLGLKVHPQPEDMEVEENGNTFKENAQLKARTVALATASWALADDSGLSVAALGGAPGVHSARYADGDDARIHRLLAELKRIDATETTDRRAVFTAALALANPSGDVVLEVEGHCAGSILMEPRGEGGFGYDPIFRVDATGLSYAEMSSSQKAQIGHRGQAFAALRPRLQALMQP